MARAIPAVLVKRARGSNTRNLSSSRSYMECGELCQLMSRYRQMELQRVEMAGLVGGDQSRIVWSVSSNVTECHTFLTFRVDVFSGIQ